MGKDKPIISIGMPVYNGELFICDALDSLLSQTFIDFELIISDNASTDNTEKICRDYAKKDKRIRYIRQTKNLGAISNFQVVLNQAVGAYFMWAAYDDKWSIDWLEQLQKKIISTGVGMVFGSVVHINASGVIINHPANYTSFRFTGCSLWRRIKFYLKNEALGKANTIYALYKIEILTPLNMLLDEFNNGNCFYDFTIVYGCLKHQELEKVDNVFLFKRIHDKNEALNSHNKHNKLIIVKKFSRAIYPFLPKLISDYFSHSSFVEKVVLCLFFPIKLLIHYAFIFYRVSEKIKALIFTNQLN